MKREPIYLLLFLKSGKPFFIASQRKTPEWSGKHNVPGSLAGLKRKILNFYKDIKEHFDPQESVCSILHFADPLVIIHPQGISSSESEKIFDEFLFQAGKKHSFWLFIDVILALMGGLLTPLPGPNLFFFYPAARAISHYYARRGVNSAKDLQKKSFIPNAAIDIIQKNLTKPESVRSEIAELENNYGFSHVERLILKFESR